MDNLPALPKRRPGNPQMRKGLPSVNPRGAPRKAESLAQAVRDAVSPTELVAKMLKLAESAESEQVRYQALAWIGERGHGKVTSDYSVTVSQGQDERSFEHLSDDRIRALLAEIDGESPQNDG